MPNTHMNTHTQHKYICSLMSIHNQIHEEHVSHFRLMDPCWAAKMKEDRRINFDDLWKLLVMTFMNILWKVENVIINFYIRKWGRNIKQTALNIERGPHVKRIVSGIMGALTGQKRWDEKRDDNQTSRIILLLCRERSSNRRRRGHAGLLCEYSGVPRK